MRTDMNLNVAFKHPVPFCTVYRFPEQQRRKRESI